MNRYTIYIIAFIINAAVLATISSISIETRFAIDHTPTALVASKSTLSEKIIYYIKVLPYWFAERFGLLNKQHQLPELIKLIFTFVITFVIALFVYHLFLGILGYKKVYKYFFGNFVLTNKLFNKQK